MEYRDKCRKKAPACRKATGALIDGSHVRSGTFYAPRH